MSSKQNGITHNASIGIHVEFHIVADVLIGGETEEVSGVGTEVRTGEDLCPLFMMSLGKRMPGEVTKRSLPSYHLRMVRPSQ